MAVKINNISYSGFFYNGEALTAMYLNGNKVYGSESQPQEYSITLTPVEWVSNENLSTRIWLDLGYVWKNNSRAQLGFVIPGTHQKPNGQQVFGEDTVWASDGNGPVDDNNDLRLFFTKSSTNIGAYWDVATSRIQATIGAITDVWQDWEIGNNYIKNLSNNTNFVTGSTYNISRTGTVGLYGACQYLNTGRTDCVRYSYVRIYEGDTLVKDVIPVLDNNNIPCFFDKISEELIYYKVNGEPSTGLTAGNATGSTIKIVYSESSVTISNSSVSGITVGNTFNLNASVVPTGSTLTYTSSNPLVASVDSNGIVSGVASGSTTITITASEYVDDENRIVYRSGTSTVSLSVIDNWVTTGQTISYTALPQGGLAEGGTHNLNASTSPIGGTLSYSSSNSSVATVNSSGIVTAVAEGNATITISVGAWDDNVNHIHYTASSETVSVVVNGAEVVIYDFMDGDGNDYIITDYAPNSNSVIEVKFKNLYSYGTLIGFRNDIEGELFCFEDGSGYVYAYGDGGNRVSTPSFGGVIKQSGSSVEVDGNVIGSTSYISNTDNLPLYIFALNREGSAYNPYNGKIYYVKVWENNTLVHEWVGATKGNKVGMYDTVTSAFTASQNNDLTVGNEVLPENSKYFLIKSAPSRGVPNVSFSKKGTPSGSLYYRVLGNAAWTEVTGDTSVQLGVNSGEIGYVELKGSIHNTTDNQWQIGGYGIEPQGFLAAIARNEEITSSNNSIAGTYAKFYNLFNGIGELTNVTNIIFPTDTDPACYKGMFINCGQITTAPILPATSLSSECYKNMFKGCYELRTIPSAMLPATTLAEDCYYGMFEECFNITTAPILPATSTTQGCYAEMFKTCMGITELRVSFTSTPAATDINNWLSNIWSPGTLYAPSNATYTSSDLQLPSTWTLSKTL